MGIKAGKHQLCRNALDVKPCCGLAVLPVDLQSSAEHRAREEIAAVGRVVNAG